jgi:hypothetical protein
MYQNEGDESCKPFYAFTFCFLHHRKAADLRDDVSNTKAKTKIKIKIKTLQQSLRRG